MEKSLVVGIIGGGIGGVALAESLRQRGISFHLFEQAPMFGEVGAGIQMTPNAVKILNALGLEDEIQKVGFLPEAMVGRSWDSGDELFRTPIKDTFNKIFGAEYYHLHRADLHAILTKRLPESNITFNVKCVDVKLKEDKAVAIFDNGDEFEADLIIGADGIRSVVREALWGKDDPKFTGDMCWRALVPVDQHPLPFVEPAASFWFGPKAHVVTYYVKGGNAVNIVACKETDEWVKESWTEPSSTSELLKAYEGWHSDLIRLFERTDNLQVFKWGLYDRDPMERWSKGHATLLGDAAHPMLPYLSQGAAMAIEDAYVLSEALDHFEGDICLALEAYEGERRSRTRNVQLQSRERGRTYHLESPEEQYKRNQAIQERQKENPNAVGISSEWVYEYDATTCRQRFDPSKTSV
ncbi:FAD-dependent monooxygenase [Alkalihalobacillus oceani]|uniref:FAD-dependent monooxygenase n=1 Tax=Halalkalibacter oceani TaxID=1653776 RepID=UPI00203A9E50|nr:FAD-dependent monooxygenase [Halalkalibacter oceani]MCM3759874.1 FAD-dependent monooxygenase [Halalkalibacter oceani]